MMSKFIILLALASAAFALKCQKCDSSQGDCNTGVCEGAFCTAIITENKVQKTRAVSKGCAPSNPSNLKEDGCQKDTTPDGSETARCGCNSGENCNSEAGIARMQAMLTNQFTSLSGNAGNAGGVQTNSINSAIPNQLNPGSQPSNGQPPSAGTPPLNGQPPSNNLPQVNPGLINPNSTFTDVLSGQPNQAFGGNTLGQQQLQQVSNARLPLPQPGAGSQFPPPNGSQQPFPQGNGNIPPSISNQRPDSIGPANGPVTGFSPNSNVDNGLNNETNHSPSDIHPMHPPTSDNGNSLVPDARSRSGPPVNGKNGMRTCACTEPACAGPCKGEACYHMMFSASDVHSQAFAGKQGQIVQAGCTDDATAIPGGLHNYHRQLTDYKFKLNGQELTVPASAFYCNDGDYCNSAETVLAGFLVPVAIAFVVFRNRF